MPMIGSIGISVKPPIRSRCPFTVFVKDAVIGDTVTSKIIKAKKNYGYGRLMEVLKPSPYRVEPKCEFARQCGGCQLQALSYDQQLVFKTNKVKPSAFPIPSPSIPQSSISNVTRSFLRNSIKITPHLFFLSWIQTIYYIQAILFCSCLLQKSL